MNRVAFRSGLTADSRLHIASVCRCVSLVELRGLKWIKLYDPHTSVDQHDAGVSMALRCWPSKKLSFPRCRRHRLEREWAKYRSNNACVGRRRGALSPTVHIPATWALQMTITEIIIAVLHCLRETCIRVRYRTISGHRDITGSTNPRSISRNRYEPE